MQTASNMTHEKTKQETNVSASEERRMKFILAYSMPSIHKYLLKKYMVDIGNSDIDIPNQTPDIKIDYHGKRYKLYLDIVEPTYMLDFNVIDDYKPTGTFHDELINHCTFLVNAAKTSFDIIKRMLKSHDNDDYFLIHLDLLLDVNTTLYIDTEDTCRIGIIIEPIN